MSRGRPKKKPNLDTAKEQAEMVKRACELMAEPYDDRVERDGPLPTMNEVAREMDITIVKLKRLLITGGFYSSATSRAVQTMFQDGKSIERICEDLNIRQACAYSNLPYSKGAYNLIEPSLYSEQGVRYRKRKKAVETLQEMLQNGDDCRLALWECICAFQEYPFMTAGRKGKGCVKFRYKVSEPGGAGGRHYEGPSVDGFGNEMWISTGDREKKKSISRSTVDRALEIVLKMNGVVKGPKALGLPGAGSYLYPVFVRFGLIIQASHFSTEEMPWIG